MTVFPSLPDCGFCILMLSGAGFLALCMAMLVPGSFLCIVFALLTLCAGADCVLDIPPYLGKWVG